MFMKDTKPANILRSVDTDSKCPVLAVNPYFNGTAYNIYSSVPATRASEMPGFAATDQWQSYTNGPPPSFSNEVAALATYPYARCCPYLLIVKSSSPSRLNQM